MSRRRLASRWRAQRGFAAVLSIVVLVIMALLGAALVTIGTTAQYTSAQDVLSARALAAARTGTDVGLFKALSSTTPADPWKSCSNLAQALDLRASTGFRVEVSCNSWTYNEGESAPGVPVVVRVYQITATACNSPTACPDATMVSTPGYVERTRQINAIN
jgi:MSHA biogenesis protein MshP